MKINSLSAPLLTIAKGENERWRKRERKKSQMKRRGMFGEARHFLSGNDTYKKTKGSNRKAEC